MRRPSLYKAKTTRVGKVLSRCTDALLRGDRTARDDRNALNMGDHYEG